MGDHARVSTSLPALAGSPAERSPRFERSRVYRLVATLAWGETDTVLLTVLALFTFVLIRSLPNGFLQDTWLALVAGRELWHSGIPHHELLTTFSAGSRWVDQQWLSQLTIYGLWRFGGLGLLGVVNASLTAAAVAGAVAAARRLGARASGLIWLLPLCLWPMLLTSEVRPQPYAYPLFVVCVYLLASDSRTPSRRVYWCLPLLIVWANIHGSAILGASLVSLRGLTLAWEQRNSLAHGLTQWARPLTLTIAPLACLMVTPYATGTVSYYEQTLLNNSFRQFVTEWQPVTAAPLLAVPLFGLAGIAIWSFGRYAGSTTLWERCAVVLLAIAGILALRNVVWFALAGLMLVSVSISGAAPPQRRYESTRRRINAVLAISALAACAIAAAAAIGRPARSFERAYPQAVLTAVNAATKDPSVKVLADAKFADWLLWREPDLGGRVAYDARFELIGSRRMSELAHMYLAVGVDWKQAARGYRLLVLDEQAFPDSSRAFLEEPGRRVLYRRDHSLVILRDAKQS